MSFMLLGILNSQAAGGGVASDYDFIETVTATGVSSVTLSGLSAYTDYKHLQIRFVAQGAGLSEIILRVRMNGNTAANYAYSYVSNSGADRDPSLNQIYLRQMLSGESSNPGNGLININDFSHASKSTSITAIGGSRVSSGFGGIVQGLYKVVEALDSIEIYNSDVDYTAPTSFSLYGLKG
jgi:hypothetical protein